MEPLLDKQTACPGTRLPIIQSQQRGESEVQDDVKKLLEEMEAALCGEGVAK